MELIKANEYEDLSMELQYQIVAILDKNLIAKGLLKPTALKFVKASYLI